MLKILKQKRLRKPICLQNDGKPRYKFCEYYKFKINCLTNDDILNKVKHNFKWKISPKEELFNPVTVRAVHLKAF